MTQVRFGGNGTLTGYKLAQWSYDAPDKFGDWAQKTLGDNRVGKGVSGFIKKYGASDFNSFTNVGIGKFKTMIAEPPKLPLLLLLYPGTVGPRLYRAYQRGKENHDYREMGDVLRRDLSAITLFVFALTPMVNFTSKLMERVSQVNLINPKTKEAISYNQFKNYEIDNAKALWQIVKEGNGEGLLRAVNGLNDGGLHRHGKEFGALKNTLEKLKAGVKDLVEKHGKPSGEAGSPGADKAKLEAIEKAGLAEAEKAYAPFETAKTDIQKALEAAGEKGSKEIIEIAKNLQGKTQDVLKNYAKVRRLPSDMFSFAVMIGLIGWFPMWFNGQWNKKQFEKKHAVQANRAASPNPVPAKPAPLPNRGPAQAVSPFASAYPAFSAQRNANPFQWQG